MDEQRLDGHKKTLGIIYIISACLSLLTLLSLKAILEIVFAFAFEDASGEEERVMEFVSSITTIIGAVILIFAVVPEFIAGVGLVTRQSWAMIFGLIVGGINLLVAQPQ
jgi:hypothetical protein